MLSTVGLLALVGAVTAQNISTNDPQQYVLPLTGTGANNHVFPGPSLPFSMAKPGADCIGPETQAGFHPDLPVVGFSQMHDDGVGGTPSLGIFPVFPHVNCKDNDWRNCPLATADRAQNYTAVNASVGYFSITLNSSVQAELASTQKTALHRYTFPQGSSAVLGIDLEDLGLTRQHGELTIENKGSRVAGAGTFKPSFGIGTYDAYFCADLNGADVADYGVYSHSRAGKADYINITDIGQYTPPPPAGALLQLANGTDQVLVRVGISFVSADQACSNGENEIPDFDFEGTVQAAKSAWNDELGKIDVSTPEDTGAIPSTELLQLFYSSLYRTMLSPQNYTGENQLWESDAPVFSSFYCIWDLFRTNFPLYSIIAPNAEEQMLNSLLDVYEHEGYLPDCRMSFNKGYTQGGSNADSVFADAFVKGVGKDTVDWDKVYEALVKDADIEAPDWGVEGRGGMQSWNDLHYIPAEDFDILGNGLTTRSCSRTLEYAYNDFGIALVAKGMNKSSDCNKYMERSGYWKNIWNNETSSDEFTGFLQPKYLNGTWGFQDPKFCSPALNWTSCYLQASGGEFYEAASWTYSLLASHDYSTIVEYVGGPDKLAARLDAFFHRDYQDAGDEIGWLPIYLGNYAGNTAIAGDRVRELIPSQFNTSLVGLPGNDDSGAMASFSVFASLGFYPNAGQNVYLLSAPLFNDYTIQHEQTGNSARVTATGLSSTNKYIQSATLNGDTFDQAWITQDFFKNGDHLEYQMGPNPSDWGKNNLPPSVGTGDYQC